MRTEAPSAKSNSILESVRQQFRTWRKTKTGRERIPDTLWRAAAGLFNSGDNSLHEISKALRLNYTDLKKHVEQQFTDPIQPESKFSPTFIELEPPISFSECVIEMEDTSGATMRMCFRGKPDSNLVELSKFFWRKQA